MIEKGRYRARAVEWGLGLTGTGKEQVAVLFELLDHPGTTITWYGYFTDATFDRTVESLRYCGWTGDDLSDLQGLDASEVSIVVDHEPDDKGELRPRVRWVNRIGGLAMKETLDANKAKAFGAQMRGRVKAVGIKNNDSQSGDRPQF